MLTGSVDGSGNEMYLVDNLSKFEGHKFGDLVNVGGDTLFFFSLKGIVSSSWHFAYWTCYFRLCAYIETKKVIYFPAKILT